MMHKEEEDEDEDKNNNDYHDDYSHTHKHTQQMNKLQKRDDACDSCCMVRYYFPPNPIILNM